MKSQVQKQYRLLFDHVPCYVTVVDRNFRVLDANALFRSTFFRKGASTCYEMYKGSHRACTRCPAVKVFRSNRPFTSLQTGRDKEGKRTHYMVTAAPLKTRSGVVESVIEMSQDVSELMLLRERLKRVEREKLEAERYAAVGQTVAGLAHGIRNILMGFEGGLYVVRSGLERGDPELMASGWEMLRNNTRKMEAVVGEYLKFARGSEIAVSKTSPAGIARDVLGFYRDLAGAAGARLVADIEDAVRDAPLDPEGIRTCLSHLVSNAIDACRLSDRKRKKIVLSCREARGVIVYAVEDNGAGMDYEVRKKVFISCCTTKTSDLGTGLGLLVTKRIVHEHGGAIEFESVPGKGSRFTILLPRDRLPGLQGDGTHARVGREKS
ncbi:MAG: ATP-binding protein [bacterium]